MLTIASCVEYLLVLTVAVTIMFSFTESQRFVVHNTMSKSIESYYQESGRAGRDNLPAVCIVLYQKKDFSRVVCMLRNGQGFKIEIFKAAMAQARKMQQYCELKVILIVHLVVLLFRKGKRKKCINNIYRK